MRARVHLYVCKIISTCNYKITFVCFDIVPLSLVSINLDYEVGHEISAKYRDCGPCLFQAHSGCHRSLATECHFGTLRKIFLTPYCVTVPRLDFSIETILSFSKCEGPGMYDYPIR